MYVELTGIWGNQWTPWMQNCCSCWRDLSYLIHHRIDSGISNGSSFKLNVQLLISISKFAAELKTNLKSHSLREAWPCHSCHSIGPISSSLKWCQCRNSAATSKKNAKNTCFALDFCQCLLAKISMLSPWGSNIVLDLFHHLPIFGTQPLDKK